MYACMHVCMCACVHVCMYAYMHVCMSLYACAHACMYACVHVCMYACMHVAVCMSATQAEADANRKGGEGHVEFNVTVYPGQHGLADFVFLMPPVFITLSAAATAPHIYLSLFPLPSLLSLPPSLPPYIIYAYTHTHTHINTHTHTPTQVPIRCDNKHALRTLLAVQPERQRPAFRLV